MEPQSTQTTGSNTLVLNNANSFGVFDRWGNIEPEVSMPLGLFHNDTRFVSKLRMSLGGHPLVRLSSHIQERNELMQIDLSNPRQSKEDIVAIPQGVIHIRRESFLLEGAYYEKISISNFGQAQHSLSLSFEFDSDFKDIFEIRGQARAKRGVKKEVEETEKGQYHIRYDGLDGLRRCTCFRFQPAPNSIEPERAAYQFRLDVGEQRELYLTIAFQTGEEAPLLMDYQPAYKCIQAEWDKGYTLFASIHSSNELFNHWIHRSLVDLESLISHMEEGAYPFAGVPWFNTIFGRDGLITAMEALWAAPYISQGVLKALANRQARAVDAAKDAEPGKILHETRSGEMSATNEIPFEKYYGSVDSTLLFIMLAGAYYRRTADLETIRSIWKNILAGLEWMDTCGELGGDEFIGYAHQSEDGLANQGWKDSADSISHADGRLAAPPIFLCEVQGYAYAAKVEAAVLSEALGNENAAHRLREEARVLKEKFNEAFWDEELQCFVMALDGNRQPCRVISSNAGQCLLTGIVADHLVAPLVRTLMDQSMFSGWGIRTLGSQQARYNPMSYHNGSVWPHDTALIAYGMMQHGFVEESTLLLNGLFDAACSVPSFRLPELFCGFTRKDSYPVEYPVACSPQAWAVASCFLLIQSILGLEIRALDKEIHFRKPNLPHFIKTLHLRNIILDGAELNIELIRHAEDVGVNILSKPRNWTVVVTK